MYCKRCLAAGVICACALSNAYLDAKFEAVACGEFRGSAIICGLLPFDMSHDEPPDMPGPPQAKLPVTVSTSGTTVLSPNPPPSTST